MGSERELSSERGMDPSAQTIHVADEAWTMLYTMLGCAAQRSRCAGIQCD